MEIFNSDWFLLIAFIAKNLSIISNNVVPPTLVLNRLPLEMTIRHSCKWGDVSKNILAASLQFWFSRYPEINRFGRVEIREKLFMTMLRCTLQLVYLFVYGMLEH